MSLLLELIEGEDAGRHVELTGAIEIGREGGVGIALSDPQVSRRHARVVPCAGGALVEDLGSSNGTWVNGQPVEGHRAISSGDTFRVGLTVFQLRTETEVAAAPSAAPSRPPVTSVGADVLAPARSEELAPVPPPAIAPPALRIEETEPEYVPDLAGTGAGRGGYEALAALVDSRVKSQTGTAAFALLAAVGLAVAIYFGA